MKKEIIAILEGFQTLLPSLIEIVVHDIEEDKIIYKKGNLTKRVIGDGSYLDKNADYKNIDQFVYDQVTIEGKEMRSISVPIYTGLEIKELICINCDISIFKQMQSISNHFLDSKKVSNRPEILFKNEYKEKINSWIKQQLEEYRLKLDELDSKTKKDLVYKLHIQNAFEEKNAVNHVANALQMGRATIFKYLKEWRNEDDK